MSAAAHVVILGAGHAGGTARAQDHHMCGCAHGTSMPKSDGSVNLTFPSPSAGRGERRPHLWLATHSWMRMSSTDSGSEPEPITTSLNALMSNFGPSALAASARSCRMRIMPIL